MPWISIEPPRAASVCGVGVYVCVCVCGGGGGGGGHMALVWKVAIKRKGIDRGQWEIE